MKTKFTLFFIIYCLSLSGISQQTYDLPNNIILLGKNRFQIPTRNFLPLINNWGTEYGTAYYVRILKQGQVMLAFGREGGYFFNFQGFQGRPFIEGDLMRLDYRNILNLYASYNILKRKGWRHNFYIGAGPTFRNAGEEFFDYEISGGFIRNYGRIGKDWGFVASLDYLFRPFRHWVVMPSFRYYTYPFWQNELPFPDPRITKPEDMIGFGVYVGFAF